LRPLPEPSIPSIATRRPTSNQVLRTPPRDALTEVDAPARSNGSHRPNGSRGGPGRTCILPRPQRTGRDPLRLRELRLERNGDPFPERSRAARERFVQPAPPARPFQRSIIPQGEVAFELVHSRDPIADHGRRKRIRKRRRRGPLAGAEREDVDLHEADAPADVRRLFEVLFRFSGETHHQVGGKGRMVEPLPHLLDSLQKPTRAVAAPHAAQDAVRSALQGRMKLRQRCSQSAAAR